MDIEAQLLAEHSKFNTACIADYIGCDPGRFRALMTLFLKGSYRITQRAAWAVFMSTAAHPELIKPYLAQLIRNLDTPGLHPAVRRNSLKILEGMTIPATLHGEAIDICFRLLADKKQPVAIKALSMTVLFNLAGNEPALKKELKILIEDQMPYTTPAFQSRGKRILSKM